MSNIEESNVCKEPVTEDTHTEGGEAQVQKAIKKKYTARQKALDGTIKKLVSVIGKLDAALKDRQFL